MRPADNAAPTLRWRSLALQPVRAAASSSRAVVAELSARAEELPAFKAAQFRIAASGSTTIRDRDDRTH